MSGDKPTYEELERQLNELRGKCATGACAGARPDGPINDFFFKNSPEPIVVIDGISMKFVDVNQAAMDMYGYTREEFMRMTPFDLSCEQDKSTAVSEKMKQGENPQVVWRRHRKKDGSIIDVEIITGITEMNGRPMGIGFARDVTEKKRSEEALKASEEKVRAVLNASTDIIHLIDSEGIVLAENAACVEMVGSLLGTSVYSIMDPEPVKYRKNALDEMFSTGEAVRMIDDVDGRNVFATQLYPVRNDKGEVVAAAVYARNITDRVKAEEELKKHRERLEELVEERTRELQEATEQLVHAQKMEAIGSLAGGMAHEFNNVLATISGTAEMLANNTEPGTREHRMAERILKSSRRGGDMTRKLLTFARKEKLNITSVSVKGLIADIVEILKGTIPKKIIVSTNTPAGGGCFVKADANQITQAILNVCLNACDAMADGGKLNIRVGACAEPGCDGGVKGFCEVLISDTGPGVPPGNMDKIFNPFFTTKESGKGTGLGLSITHGILMAHDGSIEVAETGPQGTTFRLRLPVREASSSEPGKEPSMRHSQGRGGRLLIVDDDTDFLGMAGEALELEGFEVVAAGSGTEAIRLFENGRNDIDAVVLDLVMPGMEGPEVFYRLKEIDPGVKVVLCSGFSVEGMATDLMEKGASFYIQKPFSVSDMGHILEELIGKG